jgi:hypothetical protein
MPRLSRLPEACRRGALESSASEVGWEKDRGVKRGYPRPASREIIQWMAG